MNITVELTGAAHSLTGQKIIPLQIEAAATYQDIIRLLAQRYPVLVGVLIDPDGETFLSSNMFIINGNMATPAMIPLEHPHEGDHLILMSLITGG